MKISRIIILIFFFIFLFQSVPDEWPILPIIAVNKHPVFPKFIKIVEVTNPNLMDILRRKVRLQQPYAGVFVKKNDDNADEVVKVSLISN